MRIVQLFFLTAVLLLSLGSCSPDSGLNSTFDAAKQAETDAARLKAWFAERGLTDSVTRTSSGLYYRITKKNPDSVLVAKGNRVFVNYEGRLLNDTLFGTSLKSAVPFSFIPGSGGTIEAWEEGILLFRKGEEGYLYTPSGLAYGNNSRDKIPANSCLRFFVRVENVEK
jgi:FKBP-type peptidyl-prolyl cis-trans isomerase